MYGEQIIGEGHIDKVTRYDEQLRDSITNNTNAQELLLNIYRVMLTRAKKVCAYGLKMQKQKNISKRCVCWRNSDGKIRRIIGTNKEI